MPASMAAVWPKLARKLIILIGDKLFKTSKVLSEDPSLTKIISNGLLIFWQTSKISW